MTYKFFKKETNEWVDADPETWQWEAHYDNGEVLKQFDDKGIFHQFTEIQQNKLVMFKMVSENYPQEYSLLFTNSNMKLIHFYRNTILNAGTDEEQRIRLYCFGYEKKSGNKIDKTIMMITPDNNLIVTEDPAFVVI